ncbi:microprocessor complex subunit DGCR8 isoform X2 [Macrobrachium rosenbergii]|uniref:microprocessor complex subunit DGCR8 isoform X2 n=1 Tax=Macrobrachium rosenbergii TaxID=79674 RepID=UPI0034D4A7CA
MEEGPPRKQARLESDTEDGRSSNGDTTLSLEHDEQCPFPWSGSKSTGTRASGGNSVMTDERYADFQLLDEVHEDDNEDDDDNDADGQDTEDDYDYDSEVPEEEIDALLEEGLPEEMKGPRKRKRDAIIGEGEEAPYDEREKLVLIEKGNNHFEVLPEGWVQVTHNSGMPVYLHKQSRVCTMSKPYFLGQGSVRKHDIPLSAVPCLQYLKALREEIQSKEGNGEGTSEEKRDSGLDKTAHSSKDGGDSHALETGAGNEGVNKTFSSVLGLNPLEGNPTPPPALVVGNAKIETAVENLQQQSLEVEELREYCRKRFNFKAIKIIRFKSWAERRKYQKLSKRKDRPQLPEGTKLISLRRQEEDGAFTTTSKKEWIMNPKGKSYVCILHEYVQHALKKQPKYVFKEVENAATPYAATIIINDMPYSTGYGSSKKQAKTEAAKSTLEILLPELGKKIREESNTKGDADLSKLHPHISSWGSLLRLYGNRSMQTMREKKAEEQEITLLQSNATVNQPNTSIINKLKKEMLKLQECKSAIQPIGKFMPPEDVALPSASGIDLNNVDL